MDELIYLRAETGALRTAGGALVVPIVALVAPIVLHAVNSDAAEFIPLSTLSSNVAQWTKKPITHGHPQKDGRQISANDPRILEAQGFGTIENPRVEGGKLLMDAHLDETQAQRIGAGPLLARLKSGQTCDVSVGCFVTCEATPGTHAGRSYVRRWSSLVPDHLSFVSRGACSAADGCFARAASAIVDPMTPPDAYAADILKQRQRDATPRSRFEDDHKAERTREIDAWNAKWAAEPPKPPLSDAERARYTPPNPWGKL
jgi:hypothetical protein